MSELGADVSTYPDLGENLALVTGPKLVAEALWRRFSTPRGGLTFHPNYGFDLRGLLGESFTPDSLPRMKAQVEAEALKEERVLEVSATLEYLSQSRKLAISIAGTTAEGPFQLTMLATTLGVALLEGV